MTWGQLKLRAAELEIKDDDKLFLEQIQPYCSESEVCSISKIEHPPNKGFIIRDSNYMKEYKTPGFDRE